MWMDEWLDGSHPLRIEKRVVRRRIPYRCATMDVGRNGPCRKEGATKNSCQLYRGFKNCNFLTSYFMIWVGEIVCGAARSFKKVQRQGAPDNFCVAQKNRNF